MDCTYSEEINADALTKTCMGMFMVAFFITAKTWKQPGVHQQVDKYTRGVHPYSVTLLCHKKESTSDTHSSMQDFQNNYAE